MLPLGLMHALRTGHQVSPKDVDQMVCVLAPTGLEKKVHRRSWCERRLFTPAAVSRLEKKVHQRPGVNGVSSHLQL